MTKKNLCLLAIFSIILTGCDTLRDTFGLSHYQPDDFAVQTNSSLSIPPDFSLIPPQAGAEKRGEKSASYQAHQTIFGEEKVKTVSSNKGGDSDFIKAAAQGREIDPNIKSKVNEEAKNDNPIMNTLTSLKNQAARNLKTTATTKYVS